MAISGNLFTILHDSAGNLTGDIIRVYGGQGVGTFNSGNFVNFYGNTTSKFTVDYSGKVTTAATTMVSGANTLTFPGATDTLLGNAGSEPAANGYKAWTFDPAVTAPATFVPVKGTIYYTAVTIPAGFTLANVDFYISSAGAMGASTPTFYIGVYSAAGVQLAVSANVQSTVGANTGRIAIPVSYTFATAGTYYIGYLAGNSITTSPTVYNYASIASAFGNINVANGSGTVAGRGNTGTTAQTALPSPISGTPTAVVNQIWFGLR